MYNIGDKIFINSTWDWMENWAELAYDDGTVFKVRDVDYEDEMVCIEVEMFDDEYDDYVDDIAWVSFDNIQKYYKDTPIELSGHDLKYQDVIYKIHRMRLKRKEFGYAF